jgi:hypothetical protein
MIQKSCIQPGRKTLSLGCAFVSDLKMNRECIVSRSSPDERTVADLKCFIGNGPLKECREKVPFDMRCRAESSPDGHRVGRDSLQLFPRINRFDPWSNIRANPLKQTRIISLNSGNLYKRGYSHRLVPR